MALDWDNIIVCEACHKPEHADLIDTKDDGTGNYTIMHCVACYGYGWMPARGSRESFKVSIRPELTVHYEKWMQEAGI